MGSEVIAALELAWRAIRARHADLPAAMIVTGSGSAGRKRGLRLGHYAATRWVLADTPLAEIFIGGEGLARSAGEVMATLLHEAAHALAHEREIKDVSREGRYHNKRYRALAEEVGLQVTHHPTLGWSPTTLPDSTALVYAPAIAALDEALTTHRQAEQHAEGRRGRNAEPYLCGCGRRIRVAPTVMAQGPIICGICQQPFAALGDKAGTAAGRGG